MVLSYDRFTGIVLQGLSYIGATSMQSGADDLFSNILLRNFPVVLRRHVLI